MNTTERVRAVESSVDLRLLDLWECIDSYGLTGNDLTFCVRVMRAAYAAGMIDAVTEPVRGGWLRAHGYPVPARESK